MLIITGFIWIIRLFFAHNTVLAYGTWQGDETSGMPQKGQYSPKGGEYKLKCVKSKEILIMHTFFVQERRKHEYEKNKY